MTKTLRCPACDATGEFPVIERFDEYHMLRCINCDLEFSNPMKAASAEWYAKNYVLRHAVLDRRIRDYYRWALSVLPQGCSILDAGCGEGIFVHFARTRGFDAIGIDFSPHAIETGKQWFKSDYTSVGSFADVRMKADFRPFGAITFFEVLEHVEDPSAFISEARQLITATGFLVLSVPARNRWPFREENDRPPHHLTCWNTNALRQLFVRNGFTVEQIAQGSTLLSIRNFLLYWFRKTLYRILGIGFHSSNPTSGSEVKRSWLHSPMLKKLLALARPRELISMILLPIAIMIYPFLKSHFNGYNLFLLARPRSSPNP